MVTFIAGSFYHNKKGKITLFLVLFHLAHWFLNSNIHKNVQVQGAQQNSVWATAPQRFWFCPAGGLRHLFSEPVSHVVLGLHLKDMKCQALPFSALLLGYPLPFLLSSLSWLLLSKSSISSASVPYLVSSVPVWILVLPLLSFLLHFG